jgi:hypothetical protein
MEEIPAGSEVVLIGFHNTRFEDFLKKYQGKVKFSVCAFTTRSKSQNDMKIPDQFLPLLHRAVKLEDHIEGIKAEYKKLKEDEPQI